MTDPSAVAAAGALWVVTLVAFYVWTALALSAVFRKSGEQGWKAWVPVLNQVTLFRLGGLSGWLVLLFLVPPAGWVAMVVACHRVGAAFGFGGGMTVLAALVFPVWASVVGFGSSRWVGHDAPAGPRRAALRDDTFPPPRAQPTLPLVPPLPPSSPAAEDAAAPAAAEPAARPFAAPAPAGWTPPPVPEPAPAASWAPPASPVAEESWEAPRRSTARAASWDQVAPAETDEVTGAVAGAPGPISALPFGGQPVTRPPASASGPASVDGDTAPPQTFAPRRAGAVPAADDERDAAPGPLRTPTPDAADPWALSPEAEAFAETSGPVSAVAGAPDAGGPLSARSSVSALNRRPEIPDESFDDTIIASRRRTDWTLIPPSGVAVAIGAEVLLLGRRPAPDPEHPGAQLISIDDGTVSKTHARLVLRDEKWYVTDLHSTNGVVFATVLGTEVEVTPGVEIEAGDRFLLGDAEIRLVRSGR